MLFIDIAYSKEMFANYTGYDCAICFFLLKSGDAKTE